MTAMNILDIDRTGKCTIGECRDRVRGLQSDFQTRMGEFHVESPEDYPADGQRHGIALHYRQVGLIVFALCNMIDVLANIDLRRTRLSARRQTIRYLVHMQNPLRRGSHLHDSFRAHTLAGTAAIFSAEGAPPTIQAVTGAFPATMAAAQALQPV